VTIDGKSKIDIDIDIVYIINTLVGLLLDILDPGPMQDAVMALLTPDGHESEKLLNPDDKEVASIVGDFKNCQGVILCFDSTSRESFSKISQYLAILLRFFRMKWIPLVLVALKVDKKDKRKVTREEGEKVAGHWSIPYIECSNIDDYCFQAFVLLTRLIRRFDALLLTQSQSDDETKKKCVVS